MYSRTREAPAAPTKGWWPSFWALRRITGMVKGILHRQVGLTVKRIGSGRDVGRRIASAGQFGLGAHDADRGVELHQVAVELVGRAARASTSPASSARLRTNALVAISSEPSSLGGEHALRGEMGRRPSAVSA